MTQDQKKQYLEFAKKTAKEAGEIMHQFYRSDHQVEVKADDSPVTIADKSINSMLIQRVQEVFPDHGVLGEEESWQPDRDVVWVCDPIDGTAAFIQHIPLSMFSLACVYQGQPVVAVAYNPWSQDMYAATEGGGASRNDEPISVSKRPWGEHTRLLGSSHGGISKEPADNVEIQKKLFHDKAHTTRLPGTVFKGCLIAEGSADGRTFMHDGAHDIAALKLIIEEAGGKVTDLDGNEQRYDQPINGAVMSNGLVHGELLKLVRQDENPRD